MKDHNKKFNQYLSKGQFKLFFNKNLDCNYLITGMIDNKTSSSWSNYLRDAINNLKKEGYHYNYIAEMDLITLAHKRDMTFDFYLKHKMPAFEWKLNALINKDKKPINKVPQTWRHSTKIKFDCYRV